MVYIVKVAGDQPTQGPYSTIDEAEARLRELARDQFPASIWATADVPPFETMTGTGHLVREYVLPPD